MFDYLSAPLNFLLDHTTHNDIDFNGGRIRIFNQRDPCMSDEDSSGVTMENMTMDGGAADGIQSYIGFTVEDSVFTNIEEGAFPEFHTDAIQFFGTGSDLGTTTIRRNYFSNNIDGVVCFDGCGPALIEDNVFRDPILTEDPFFSRCMELYADEALVVQWNTFDDGCGVEVNHRDEDPVGTETVLRNNIIDGPIETGGGTPASSFAVNTHNMLPSGATGSNFNGAASFVWAADELDWLRAGR